MIQLPPSERESELSVQTSNFLAYAGEVVTFAAYAGRVHRELAQLAAVSDKEPSEAYANELQRRKSELWRAWNRLEHQTEKANRYLEKTLEVAKARQLGTRIGPALERVQKDRSNFESILRQHGLSSALARQAFQSSAVADLREAQSYLQSTTERLSKLIAKATDEETSAADAAAAIGEADPVGASRQALSDDDEGVSIPCDESEGVLIICLIIAVILLVAYLASVAQNAERDDQVRAVIWGSDCAQLASIGDEELRRMVRIMLDDFTGDDDERAMLRLFSCLGCERFGTAIWPYQGSKIHADFHGTEFELLEIWLHDCGLLGYADWDDDTTRHFIARLSCEDVDRLSLTSIRHLMRNLLAGSTGDVDERAINKLMGCLSCDRMRELLTMPGVRWSNFDDEVHGDEWDTLQRTFSRCGI